MPEAAAAIPSTPAPAAAAAAGGEGQPSGEQQGGISAAMKEFESSVTPKAKPDGKAAADGKGADGKGGDGKSADGKAKPDGKAADGKAKEFDWEKAPGDIKGAHFKMRRELESRATAAETKIKDYETRIKEIEGKSKEAPGDAKAIEGFQKQISELHKRLAATDYRMSEEFQTQHVGRWNSEYKTAIEEVKRFTIRNTDAEGKVTERAATEQDFNRVLGMDAGDQDEAINRLFGTAAQRVFGRIFRLNEIRDNANRALEEHASKAETTAKKKEATELKTKGEYNTAYTNSVQELQTNYPQYFATDEADPEASDALQKGYEFVDKVLEKSESMTGSDKAAYNAVIRARAAAFPRFVLQHNRMVAENKALKEEIAKFRKSDPGGDGGDGRGGGGAGDGEEVPGGIEAASKSMNWK